MQKSAQSRISKSELPLNSALALQNKNMNIRKYCEDDYKDILEIYSKSKLDELLFEKTEFELLPLESDEKRLTQLMESEIFVYAEKQVIGYSAVYRSEIRALFVHPDNRRKA